MLNRDSEIEILKILRTCDMNSTLGSVVPLAMFLTVYAETLFFPRKLTMTQLEKLADAADAAPRLPAFLLLALLHPAPPTSSLSYF